MERTKMPNLQNGSKGGFEPGSLDCEWRSTTELLCSISCFPNKSKLFFCTTWRNLIRHLLMNNLKGNFGINTFEPGNVQ